VDDLRISKQLRKIYRNYNTVEMFMSGYLKTVMDVVHVRETSSWKTQAAGYTSKGRSSGGRPEEHAKNTAEYKPQSPPLPSFLHTNSPHANSRRSWRSPHAKSDQTTRFVDA
jgi:hypothetical protein